MIQHGGVEARGDDPGATHTIGRRWRVWEVCFALILVLAIIVRLPRSWTVLGDNALMRMWTDAVGTANTPMVGGDARFGWNHLGPWVFYLMAVPYRLLDRSAVGLLVGAAVINVVCLLVVMRCVRDVAGQRVAVVVAGGALLFLLTASGNRLIDPWNPYVVQLTFLLALVCCWAVLNRRWQWLPWLIGAGSLCIQGHIAFLPPVAALFIAAAYAVIKAPWINTRTAVRRSAIVAVIAWLPSLVDMFMPGGHNLYRLARFFVQPSDASTNGLSAGVRVVLRETGLSASWLDGHLGLRLFTDAFDGGLGLLPGLGIIFLIVAAIVARRRHDVVLGSLVTILGLLLPVAIVEMALGRGELYPYLFGWVTLVGMMCWVAGLIAILPARDERYVDTGLTAAVTILAICLVATGFTAGLPLSPRERPQDAGIVRQLVATAESGLSQRARYNLEHGNDAFSSIYELGVVASLRRDGFRVVVEPRGRVLFGRHMTDPLACTYPTLKIVAPYEATNTGERVLALSDPLTQQRPLQQLTSLREPGRSVAVVLRDAPTNPAESCH
jgi:hypothetical protein